MIENYQSHHNFPQSHRLFEKNKQGNQNVLSLSSPLSFLTGCRPEFRFKPIKCASLSCSNLCKDRNSNNHSFAKRIDQHKKATLNKHRTFATGNINKTGFGKDSHLKLMQITTQKGHIYCLHYKRSKPQN